MRGRRVFFPRGSFWSVGNKPIGPFSVVTEMPDTLRETQRFYRVNAVLGSHDRTAVDLNDEPGYIAALRGDLPGGGGSHRP
ncbi:hypothetical protein SAMN05518861_1334 [Mesorhizobium sp. YR577]|nr:hypothetical protein SAMN05518861_1334 [Mesorhizobium sp. YR577]